MNFFFIILVTSYSATVTRVPSTGTPPVRRLYCASVIFQGNLYTFGGNSGTLGNLNELHTFNIFENLWEKIEPIDGNRPLGRMVFAMYSTDREIYIHGGLGSNGQLNEMWKFDVESTIWTRVDQQGQNPPPFYRVGYIDYTYNDTRFFAISCFGTRTQTAVNDLYVFNSETQTWVLMPKVARDGHKVPEARRMWNLNYYDGFIYLWGGDILEKAELLYRYDLENQWWELIAVEGETPTFRTFFRSVVYKDSLIIFPGWKQDEGIDIDEYWKFDFTQLQSAATPKWEELQIERPANYEEFLPRDSYALSIAGNLAYFHAGYSNYYPTANFLLSFNLDTNPLTWEIIGRDSDSPSNRYFHTMTVIQGKFYVYGGSTGELTLDELWIYDELSATWELKEAIGISPGPRMGHAAVSIGHNLIIFGGRNGNIFYSDLYSYNPLTNIWDTMDVNGDIHPAGVEGSCMLTHGDDIYIFAGKSEFKSNNQLWKFELGSKVYTLVSEDLYLSPNPVNQSSCFEMEGKLYFMYGMDDSTFNKPQISVFDLSSLTWGQYDQEVPNVYGLSAVAAANVGNIVVSASGSRWNNRCYGDVYVMNFDTGEFIQETTLEWAAYAESQVYYKNSMYVFGGGGSSPDGAIHLTLSVDRFYRITFEDLPCSAGTYKIDGECSPCPAGTYKSDIYNDFCTDCPAGTFNDHIAATDIKFCLPCPKDYFNDKRGQPFCFKWEPVTYCPVGTRTPYTVELKNVEYFDEQPDNWEPDTETVNTNIRFAAIGLLGSFGFIIIGIFWSKWFKKQIPAFDIYTQKHNYRMNKVMKVKQTFLGGLITCFAICVLFFLTTQSCLYFYYDNVIENKSLVPIVVMHDEISGDLEVTITFNGYGGQCVQSNGSCNPQIRFLDANISYKDLSELYCTITQEQNCVIKRKCNECRLEKDSYLRVSSLEEQAYAASITVRVVSQSSIPDETSSMEYELFADNRQQVFRGSEESNFHFYTIPSLFESEISTDPDEETGYHISLGDRMEPGSQTTVEDLSKSRFLHVNIEFSQGETALQTKRIYKLRDDTLVLGIIGGFAGVIQFGVLVLRLIEKRYESMKKSWRTGIKSNAIISKRQLENYWDAAKPVTGILQEKEKEILTKRSRKVAPEKRISSRSTNSRNVTCVEDDINPVDKSPESSKPFIDYSEFTHTPPPSRSRGRDRRNS